MRILGLFCDCANARKNGELLGNCKRLQKNCIRLASIVTKLKLDGFSIRYVSTDVNNISLRSTWARGLATGRLLSAGTFLGQGMFIASADDLMKRVADCIQRLRGTIATVDSTDIRHLTTGIRSKECVVMRFRRCANVIQCTYTNLDSIAYCTPRLYVIACCC